jgi:4-alpha-glucanotransferase
MPGIVETHPNWRRRYPGDSATLLDSPASSRRLASFAQARRNHRGAAHR